MSRHCYDKKCCIGIPGAPGATGATGNTGAQGATGASGASGPIVYGYAYNTSQQTVANNSYVTFSNPLIFNNITGPAVNGSDFTITVAGDYLYDFRVFGIPDGASTNIDFGLSINGFSNFLGGSINHFTTATLAIAGSVTGHGIATLRVGDIVRLTNYSGSAMILTANGNPPSLDASLRLTKMG